ncbi:HAUS augmin-like complex subunit 8 [Cuculus canorus]|uniref:HAUS augmin-like complex subunit 8 n=1 Tax=Cuculus canorus TaxID=55661 RepID=UPI0023AB4807|nr:HAUS augmin-like complex subunit 8 [Cuculus canorus]
MSVPPGGSAALGAGGEASKDKRKGGRIVKSRYLQFEKKGTKKDSSANTSSANSSLVSTAKPSAAKPTSTDKLSSAAKPRSVPPLKSKAFADVTCSSLNQSSFEKGNLQSTLLDGDKISLPDLELSAINGKTVSGKIPASNSTGKAKTRRDQKPQNMECDSQSEIEELESLTLLLTYLRVKAGKNLAKLEEKAEKNLIMLCEEKMRQQEKLYELKREILLKEREQKLDEALDKQLEVLTPLVPVCEQFKEQYKCFAAALDATRHELPIKNIHIEGDMHAYLGELEKELTVTQELLTELTPICSDESAKALTALKELKEVSQKMNKELQRSFTQMQNLASEASKEVSLHNQQICEENHGLDVVKCWYFD